MYYTIQISVSRERTDAMPTHRPVSIETLTADVSNIGVNEIRMVTEAFEKQVNPLLMQMLKAQGG